MGDRRYFLCPWGVIGADAVAKHFPDHGLLWLRGRSVSIMRAAPGRRDACHASEVVLLKFALIHVRDNLLAAGLTVDLRELTKHPVIADREGMLEGFVEASMIRNATCNCPHGCDRPCDEQGRCPFCWNEGKGCPTYFHGEADPALQVEPSIWKWPPTPDNDEEAWLG